MSTSQESSSGDQLRERDCNEVKVEIIRLVEALASSMKPATKKREWRPMDEDSLQMFHPATEKVFENLLDVLLSIFLRNERGKALLGEHAFDPSPFLYNSVLPTFTNQLTLRLLGKILPQDEPGRIQDFSPSKRCPKQLKTQIKSNGLWEKPLRWYMSALKRWYWKIPQDGGCKLYFVDRGNPFRWCCEPPVESLGTNSGSQAKFGYGALVHLQVPINLQVPMEDSVISFGWIQFILAQAGFLHYDALPTNDWRYPVHLGAFVNFLGTFAGNWSSRNERSKFLFRHGMISNTPFFFIQLHFRFFTVAESPQVGQEAAGKEGLRCKRQLAGIPSSAPAEDTRQFREREISIFGVLSSQDWDTDDDRDTDDRQARYRVTILSEAGTTFPDIINERYNLTWRQGLEGAMAFQVAVLAATNAWEIEWTNTLDTIDDCVRFQLSQTVEPRMVKEWMFDVDFEKSTLYFTLLQVLRIFREYIPTVSEDLKRLSSLFLDPDNGLQFCFPSPDELSCIKSNWEEVIRVQGDAEKRLLGRISDKTEEVKSLRDGLFNATSLQEANQSTTMNRAVIVFTVVTVLFLPPTFTSTLFGIDWFKKEDGEKKTWDGSYKIWANLTAAMCAITYFIAGISVLAVNWRHNKERVKRWWHQLTEKNKIGRRKSDNVVAENTKGAGPASKTEPATVRAQKHGPDPAAATKGPECTGGEGADTADRATRNDGVAGANGNGVAPASGSESAPVEVQHHSHEQAAAARDLERAGGEGANTTKRRSRFTFFRTK